MASIKNISIPEPCHQSWQQMTPVAAGRHCESCCKTVTDFTAMNNNEIIEYLSTSNNVCGRFQPHQLSSVNTQLYLNDMPLSGRIKGWAMAIGLLWSMASFKAVAQTGAPVAQTTIDSSAMKNTAPMMLDKIVAPRYREISGKVIDSMDNSPIPGATVSTSSNTGTFTDTNGNFKLRALVSDTALTARFIGYQPQVIKINQSKMEYTVTIKQSEMVLGELVYIRPPFFKRVYYRFIKNPIRKLFKAI